MTLKPADEAEEELVGLERDSEPTSVLETRVADTYELAGIQVAPSLLSVQGPYLAPRMMSQEVRL